MPGARSRGVVAAATSAGLSLSTTIFLIVWPCWGISVTPTGPGAAGPPPESRCHSLVSVEGWWVLGLLSVPMVFSFLGFLAARRGERGLVWGLATLLFLFCGIGAFSVGFYYLPSLAALVTSAVRMKGAIPAGSDASRVSGTGSPAE